MKSTLNNLKKISEETADSNIPLSYKDKLTAFVTSIFSGNKKTKTLMLIELLIILLTILFVFMYQNHSLNSKQTTLQSVKNETILRELSDVNNKLDEISHHPENKNQIEVIQAIQSDLTKIQKSIIEVAKTSEIEKVSSQLTLVKDDVDNQMNEIKKAVSEGLGNKQYLDVDALPFKVISVDSIAGRSYASIDYANHISPLGISDMLAGWRLINADYDAAYAEFVNAKNQYVKVSLQG